MNKIKNLILPLIIGITLFACTFSLAYKMFHEPTLEELYQEAEGTLMSAFIGTDLCNVNTMDVVEDEDRYIIHIHFVDEEFKNVNQEDWNEIIDSLKDASLAWRKVLDKEQNDKKLEFRIGTPDEQHIYLKIVDAEIIINDMNFK